MATYFTPSAKLLLPALLLGTFLSGTAQAGKYSCSLSAQDVLHPHQYSDSQTDSAVKSDLNWLHSHGDRVEPAQKSRCGDKVGKNERSSLKLFRKKNIALACFCSNNKSKAETNPQALATHSNPNYSNSAPTSGAAASPDFTRQGQGGAAAVAQPTAGTGDGSQSIDYGALMQGSAQPLPTETTVKQPAATPTTPVDPYEGYQYGAGN